MQAIWDQPDERNCMRFRFYYIEDSIKLKSTNTYISDMKPTELYQQLQEIASRLGIAVSEQNLRVTGVNAKSGLCRVRGQQVFIMDKHLTIREKVETLSECIRQMPLDDIYLVPAIRQYLLNQP
jgi:hypothetical protein